MDLTPLRNRDYRLLFTAQFVSLIGTMVTYVALPYQMYRLTGSSFSVGLLGLVELVPLLATAFIGGAMADAVDRRRIAIFTDVALSAGSATLAVIATRGASPALLYLVAAWMSAVSGLQRPAIESLVPRLVEKHELPAAASLSVPPPAVTACPTIRPHPVAGRAGPSRSRERLSHKRSVVAGEQQYVKTHKK